MPGSMVGVNPLYQPYWFGLPAMPAMPTGMRPRSTRSAGPSRATA